jgi:hypothetical protein
MCIDDFSHEAEAPMCKPQSEHLPQGGCSDYERMVALDQRL